MIKRIFSLQLFVWVMIAATAQQPASAPITWRTNIKMSSATEGEVILKATIQAGWHLYGTTLPANTAKPTRIDLTKSQGVKLIGGIIQTPAPTEVKDKMFNSLIPMWTTAVTLRQKFKVTDPVKAHIAGTLTYMGCNDVTCMPPSTYNISKKLPPRK